MNRIWKKKRKKMLFPTPVLRPMTAATVGIVSAPPVMSRNSVITAAPARIFPIRKNPATAMRAPIVINDKKDADVLCMSASQTVDKALLLQGFAIVGTAFLI